MFVTPFEKDYITSRNILRLRQSSCFIIAFREQDVQIYRKTETFSFSVLNIQSQILDIEIYNDQIYAVTYDSLQIYEFPDVFDDHVEEQQFFSPSIIFEVNFSTQLVNAHIKQVNQQIYIATNQKIFIFNLQDLSLSSFTTPGFCQYSSNSAFVDLQGAIFQPPKQHQVAFTGFQPGQILDLQEKKLVFGRERFSLFDYNFHNQQTFTYKQLFGDEFDFIFAAKTSYFEKDNIQESIILILYNGIYQTFLLPVNSITASNSTHIDLEINSEVISSDENRICYLEELDGKQRIYECQILCQVDKIENTKRNYDLIIQPNTFSFIFQPQQQSSNLIQIQLNEDSLINPNHPKIALKKQNLAEIKKQSTKNDQKIMFHPPKPLLKIELPWSEKQKLAKKKPTATQPQTAQKQQNQFQKLFSKKFPSHIIIKLEKSAEYFAALTNQRKTIFFKPINGEIIAKFDLNSGENFSDFTLHKGCKLVAFSAAGRIDIYGIISSQPKLLYSIQQQKQINTPFLSFLWPQKDEFSLFVCSNSEWLEYYHVNEKYSILLKRVSFPLQIGVGAAFSFVKSTHIIIGFQGFDAEKPENPWLVVYDFVSEKTVFTVRNKNSASKKSISKIFLPDFDGSHSSLFGVESGNQIVIYDFQQEVPVRSFEGKNGCFIGQNFVLASGKVYDIQNGKEVRNSLRVNCSVGTGSGAFCGFDDEIFYYK